MVRMHEVDSSSIIHPISSLNIGPCQLLITKRCFRLELTASLCVTGWSGRANLNKSEKLVTNIIAASK